jgi:hypothetical protein
VYINRGEATFEFELPAPSRQVRIERLILSLRAEGGWQQRPQVAVYDWSEGAWSELEEPVIGDNVLADVEGLVGDAGLVHARLSLESSGGGGCYSLGLGFEGTSLAGGDAVVRD